MYRMHTDIDRLCNWDLKNLYVLHSFLFQAPCALNLHLQFWSTALVQGVVNISYIPIRRCLSDLKPAGVLNA